MQEEDVELEDFDLINTEEHIYPFQYNIHIGYLPKTKSYYAQCLDVEVEEDIIIIEDPEEEIYYEDNLDLWGTILTPQKWKDIKTLLSE